MDMVASTMRAWRVVSIAVVLLLVALGPGFVTTLAGVREAQAFKTFSAFGGAVHAGITRDAIGDDLSADAFTAIDQAMSKHDVPGTRHFEDPAHHFVDGELRHSIRYAREQWSKGKDYARDADRDPAMRMRVYDALGGVFHAIQDFYAHSNYIELALQAGTAPDRIEPMPWDARKKPEGIRTGYFFYQDAAIHELSYSRAASIYNIQKTYPGTSFMNDVAYEQMRGPADSYQGAIAYATSGRDFLHVEVEKDNASSLQGAVVHPGSGLTLHEIARRVAVKDTRRLWQTFIAEVARDNGDRGPAIVAAIHGSTGIGCPPTLAGWALTTRPEFQGATRPERNGSLTAHCRYGDGTNPNAAQPPDRSQIKIHLTVLWAETIPAGEFPDCTALRTMLSGMSGRTGKTEVVGKSSPTRWAAWSFSMTDMPESVRGEIQGLAERLFDQVERRSVRCIDIAATPTPSPPARWTCEIKEYPVAGAIDHWAYRQETTGTHRVLHLVQAPGQNAFDRQRQDLTRHMGGFVELGAPFRDTRREAEQVCEQFRRLGR